MSLSHDQKLFHFQPEKHRTVIHVQYCAIMRFTVLHNRHHKVSQSVPFFMHCKTVTILLKLRVRGHFVMSNTKYHERNEESPEFFRFMRQLLKLSSKCEDHIFI